MRVHPARSSCTREHHMRIYLLPTIYIIITYVCVFRSHSEVNVLVQCVALTSWRHIIPSYSSSFSSSSPYALPLYFFSYTHTHAFVLRSTPPPSPPTLPRSSPHHRLHRHYQHCHHCVTVYYYYTTILYYFTIFATIIMRRVYINK
jgi:hypothetical protein